MTDLIDINPTAGYITAGGGKFDTRNRYIRGSASGDFPIVKHLTFVITHRSTNNAMNWRYSCGTFARAFTTFGGTAISYDAPYTLVTL